MQCELSGHYHLPKSAAGFHEIEKALNTQITFIHASVLDFLRDNDTAQVLLARDTVSNEAAVARLAESRAFPPFFSNQTYHDPNNDSGYFPGVESLSPDKVVGLLSIEKKSLCHVPTLDMLDALFTQCAFRARASQDVRNLLT